MANLDMPQREVGQRISKIRRLRGYSEEYMAQRLGISQRQYSRYETGESPLAPERLTAVCEVLEVKEQDLLNFDERMVFNHCNQDHSVFGNGNHYHEANAALVEELRSRIQHQGDEIAFLRGQVEELMKRS